MKLKDAYENYLRNSTKASDLVRQLGFAGLAIAWIFRSTDPQARLLPAPLAVPTLWIVSGLACDFLQYLVATVAWGSFHRYKEFTKTGRDAEFDAPSWINWPALALFTAKTVCIGVAYVMLAQFLRTRL